MSYLDRTRDPRRTSIAIVGVAVIHALLALVIVTGLANHYIRPFIQPPPIGRNFPLPPPPPPPTPQPKQTATPHPFPTPTAFPSPPLPLPTAGPPQPTATPGPVIPTYTPSLPPRPTFGVKPKGAGPKNDPKTWVGTEDYPARDENEGHEGTTGFRVTVTPDGRVSACEIIRSSGFSGLDAAACAAVKRRARFSPATDETGAPVAGTYTNSVRWQIPR